MFSAWLQPIYLAVMNLVFVLWLARTQGLEVPFVVDLLVLVGSLSAHALDFMALYSPEDTVNQPRRQMYFSRLKPLLPLFVFILAGVGLALVRVVEHPIFLAWAGVSGILFVLYSVPVIRVGKRRVRLKEIPYLKAPVVAGAWMMVAFGIIGSLSGSAPLYGGEWIWPSVFLLLVSDTLLLDWRDFKGDVAFGIVSFPPDVEPMLLQLIGVIHGAAALAAYSFAFQMVPVEMRWLLLSTGSAHAMMAMVTMFLPGMRYSPLFGPLVGTWCLAAWIVSFLRFPIFH